MAFLQTRPTVFLAEMEVSTKTVELGRNGKRPFPQLRGHHSHGPPCEEYTLKITQCASRCPLLSLRGLSGWMIAVCLTDIKGNFKCRGEGSVKVLALRAGTPKFDHQCKSQVWWRVLTISVLRRQRCVALWGSLASNTSYLVKFQTNGKHHLKNIKTKTKTQAGGSVSQVPVTQDQGPEFGSEALTQKPDSGACLKLSD